jgi:hypothetical protein
VVGFLVSATMSFVVLRAIGQPAIALLRGPGRSYVVTSLLVLAAAFDSADVIRRRGYSLLSIRRQTPERIAREFGLKRAALAWGLDTGLGFTTYRVSAMYWLVVALALLGSVPWWIGAVYALGFLVPLATGWALPLVMPRNADKAVSRSASAHVRHARMIAVALLCATIGAYAGPIMGG